MTGPLAISIVTISIIAAILIGLAFVAGLIVLSARRRDRAPDIPPGMQPGPADQVLEQRATEKFLGWAILFVLLMALWLPVLWFREPDQNVDDAIELVSRSEERGRMWFEVASEDNPTGFGCARCHGQNAEGGTVPFTTPEGETIEYPVPPLVDVCGGAAFGHPQITSLEDIQGTIMEGREGTPMPSWSVRFAGPMNDQQIQDLINYLISIQQVPDDQNLCTNPQAAAATPAPGPTATPTPGAPSAGTAAEEEAATPSPTGGGS